ncbi:Uncharacterised protein (plasmid) [Tsukamurella tyrosinosolvens]|uniref:Uncharacterized protein n=2 Tax=Tsukamurella tyrosinosolvens TaxID=57704 RepID=A0A1H4LFW3_TSUTY|nr:hypothetical protein AXK58_04735 [Tsukamurella tyrosinosolvens]SEB69611.1 hypothetical protein SAMN04489793_0568 [Tsukamurella tyrosinosolvens]VEH93474.1 Uncharacterised protein [Tsukamurella tyrosinosolvens]
MPPLRGRFHVVHRYHVRIDAVLAAPAHGEERMTQGQQPPEDQTPQSGTPSQFQGPPFQGAQPGMPPQFPPPAPPKRSSKTIIFVVIAVVIALIAGAALTFALTRSSDTSGTAAPSTAASSSAAGTSAYDYRLRGTMTSKASVCVAGGLTSQQLPKFETPLDYSRPTLDADIAKARQSLSQLASRISPNAAEPIRSTVQDWITAFVAILDSYERREPAADVKFQGDLVDNLAGQINGICKD